MLNIDLLISLRLITSIVIRTERSDLALIVNFRPKLRNNIFWLRFIFQRHESRLWWDNDLNFLINIGFISYNIDASRAIRIIYNNHCRCLITWSNINSCSEFIINKYLWYFPIILLKNWNLWIDISSINNYIVILNISDWVSYLWVNQINIWGWGWWKLAAFLSLIKKFIERILSYSINCLL